MIRMRVTKWDPKFRTLGYQLAANPDTAPLLLAAARKTRDYAKMRLVRQGNAVPTLFTKYPLVSYGGRTGAPSVRAPKVAQKVSIKGDRTMVARLNVGAANKISVTRVALVVSDHDYSKMWERGTYGLPNTKFMSGARKRVAAGSGSVKLRA